MTRCVLVTGAGGVGKTTLAAALAVAAARTGAVTLVVTVDPARRLADALGLVDLGSVPEATPGEPGLWGAMVDSGASWESIIRTHADPATVDRILESRFFRAIAQRFPAGQAYAAAEEMSHHLESGRWDLVVVDTPPAGGGLDFFSSPRRIRRLVGGRLLRWLTGARLPGRRRLYAVTARPVLRIADTVLGGPLLEEVADFLLDLRTAYDGIARRAAEVERHLRAATSIVVTTSDPAPIREAVRFFTELPGRRPEVVVFNRTLPKAWHEAVPPLNVPPPIAENLRRWRAEALHQAEIRRAFEVRCGSIPVCLPWMIDAPTSPDDLAALVASAEPSFPEWVRPPT